MKDSANEREGFGKRVQTTISYWFAGLRLPYRAVPKEEARKYVKLIRLIHKGIVDSTDEPRTERMGVSLMQGAISILATNRQTSDPFYQAAMIYDEMARKGHYFTEGNKRTAHCLAKAHLFTEGYHFKIRYQYAVPFIERIAEGVHDIQKTRKWLEKHSIKYRQKNAEKYLNRIIKEITVYETRGRPPKNEGKRFR